MPYLNLKANSQPIQTFYREIKEKQQLSFLHEGAVAPHFSKLLQHCGRQFNWTLIEQYPLARQGRHPLKADGDLLDEFKLIHGLWEAKDTRDDLPTEVKKKFQASYPQDNILFLSGTTHNVFGIQVGVSINIFVRKRKPEVPFLTGQIPV